MTNDKFHLVSIEIVFGLKMAAAGSRVAVINSVGNATMDYLSKFTMLAESSR